MKISTRLIVFVLFTTTPLLFGQLIPIDLSNWTQEGYQANGTWIVSDDGSFVDQSINGNPTFFVSPDTFINTIIRGTFSAATNDNDFMGFVFGYSNPVGQEDYFKFILFDWKQLTQDVNGRVAQEGFTLCRVEGQVNGSASTPYWNHSDSTMQVLDSLYGDTLGWADNTEYLVEVSYATNRVIITIDSVTIFDVEGEFPAGRFGFYNYSQPDVRYRGFSLNNYPIAVDDTASTAFRTPVEIAILENDYDPDGSRILFDHVNQPPNGSVTIFNDSLATYYPDSSFFGPDSFSYVISDSFGLRDTAHVFITVRELQTAIKEPITFVEKFILEQNYPNPFNPLTHIRYYLPNAAKVKMDIFNSLGQNIQTLFDQYKAAGQHNVSFNAVDLPSGAYYYRIEAGKFMEVKKMVYLK